MDDYLLITQLNDFIFCPYSIYLKNLFGKNAAISFSGTKQLDGKQIHESIDNNHYSTKSCVLQAIEVYSNDLKLYGKIDIYDLSTKKLIERKKKIKTIYDGYIFQLYAQYYCLKEMGYDIEKIELYSYDDNKIYDISLPDNDKIMKEKFFKVINDANTIDISKYEQGNSEKCRNCIYSSLCTIKEETLDD